MFSYWNLQDNQYHPCNQLFIRANQEFEQMIFH